MVGRTGLLAPHELLVDMEVILLLPIHLPAPPTTRTHDLRELANLASLTEQSTKAGAYA